MAVPARRTATVARPRRKAPQKKGMSNTAKAAIVIGVIAGGWLIYDSFIKPKGTPVPPPLPPPPPITPQGVIDQVNQIPTNVKPPQVEAKPSPIGTPPEKQNWGRTIKYGEKSGEVQTMQKLLNTISKMYGSTPLVVDGDYGSLTYGKKVKIMGKSSVNLADVYKRVKLLQKKKNAPDLTKFDFSGMFIQPSSSNTYRDRYPL